MSGDSARAGLSAMAKFEGEINAYAWSQIFCMARVRALSAAEPRRRGPLGHQNASGQLAPGRLELQPPPGRSEDGQECACGDPGRPNRRFQGRLRRPQLDRADAAGRRSHDRYDVVGWGQPVRKNACEPDGRWHSNAPDIVWQAQGAAALRLIPQIEAAIARYPHNVPGGYRLWPGPNSNTFVASIMRAAPEIDAVLPPNAVGRDYISGGKFYAVDPHGDVHLTLYGLAGLSIGRKAASSCS